MPPTGGLQVPADRDVRWITEEEGRALAGRIRAHAFMQCSALANDNLQAAWETMVRVGLHKGPPLRPHPPVLPPAPPVPDVELPPSTYAADLRRVRTIESTTDLVVRVGSTTHRLHRLFFCAVYPWLSGILLGTSDKVLSANEATSPSPGSLGSSTQKNTSPSAAAAAAVASASWQAEMGNWSAVFSVVSRADQSSGVTELRFADSLPPLCVQILLDFCYADTSNALALQTEPKASRMALSLMARRLQIDSLLMLAERFARSSFW